MIRGEVLERTEGFSERPGWADQGQPFGRKGKLLRVTGYVLIGGSQRLEVGFRASDSYARAELVRFLASRVSAILEDKLDSQGVQTIAERITEHAGAWVEQLRVAQRYWEKRRDGDEEKLHIWSRIDLSPEEMTVLTDRVLSQSDDLASSSASIRQELGDGWDALADPSKYSSTTTLPEGVFIPDWAKSGDRKTDSNFQFTCHGMASDEKTARLLAESQCSEKLCKLFGVQISAETIVSEDLEGISATSEVKERCADVNVLGRETPYHTGDCGPKGCIFWLQQSYPISSYEAEKKRLAQPTVIRQQVVIQEGDKLYRDPAKCRTELKAYSGVQGLTAPHFKKRSRHLHRALSFCQDIDGREVGLFSSLDHLLKAPLPYISTDHNSRNKDRWGFLQTGSQFGPSIDQSRFLIERIQIVVALVDSAILPRELYDLNRESSQQEVEAVMKQVVRLPLEMSPSNPYYAKSILELALDRTTNYSGVPYSRVLRDYFLNHARRRKLSCDSDRHAPSGQAKRGFSGGRAINYWGRDGSLDAEEWKASLSILRRTRDKRSVPYCLKALWGKDKKATSRRIDDVSELIVGGQIVGIEDPTYAFRRLVEALDAKTQLAAYRRFKNRLKGAEKERAKLAHEILSGSPDDKLYCNEIVDFFVEVKTALPEADVDDSSRICSCLREPGKYNSMEKGPDAIHRKRAVSLLFEQSKKASCGHIEEEEWPEKFYNESHPKVLPWVNSGPFGRYRLPFDAEINACMVEMNIFRQQVYVTIRANLAGGRFKSTKVNASLISTSKNLDYREKNRGFARRADIDKSNRAIAQCIEKVVATAEIPPQVPAFKSPRSNRVFWEYWGKNRGVNYYE